MTLAMSLGPLIGITIVTQANYPVLFFSGMGIGLAGLCVAFFASYPRRASNERRFVWGELIELATVPVSLVQLVLNITYGGLLSYVLMFGKEIRIANPGNFFLVLAIGLTAARLWSGKVLTAEGRRSCCGQGFA